GVRADRRDRGQGAGLRRVPRRRHAAVRGAGVLRRDRAGPDRLDLRAAARTARGLRAREELHRAGRLRGPRPAHVIGLRARMSNDLTKRLLWSGLLAALGALASIAVQRSATMIWQRAFGEDPP